MRFEYSLAVPALVAVLIPSPSRADPLALPGDRVLRQDVQLLKGYGLIPGPVDTWPLSWSHLADSLGVLPPDLPPHLEAAVLRVLRERPPDNAFRLEFGGGLTTRRSLIYGFDGGARDDVDLRGGVGRTWGGTSARLMLGYRSRDGDDRVVLDGSYLSQALGNWVVFGGAIDRWYGPGWDAGLVLSRNAKPIPGIGVFRRVPRRSESRILRWMGPWRFDAFLGVVGGDRSDFKNPLSVNLQLAMEPWKRFDLTFSRGIMICGDGRPCGLEEWFRAVFALFDLDNQDTPGKQDPSNQVASIGMSYTLLPGAVQVTPLMEWYYEDEFNYVSILLGTRVLAPAGSGTWRVQLEYSDTYANRILGILHSSWLNPSPWSTYEHFVYTDGYTYDGSSIGHSLGGSGRLTTLEGGWVSGAGYDLMARLRHAEFQTNPVRLDTPVFRETLVAEAGGGADFGRNRIGVLLRWVEDDPFDRGKTWEVEAAFRTRIEGGR